MKWCMHATSARGFLKCLRQVRDTDRVAAKSEADSTFKPSLSSNVFKFAPLWGNRQNPNYVALEEIGRSHSSPSLSCPVIGGRLVSAALTQARTVVDFLV